VLGRAGGSGTTLPLAEGDIAAIRDKVPGVTAISGMLQGSAAVVRASSNWQTSIMGVHEQYLTVRDWPIASGREFTNQDVRSGAKVAIVGKTVVEKLFGGDEPEGQVIRIKNVPFQVAGVLESKGQSTFGRDQDDVIMIPLTTGRGRIIGRSAVQNDQVGQISVKFENGTDLKEAQEQIESVLRQRRRIQPGAEDDFNVRNLAEFLKARTAAQTTLGWLLGATSILSLIVGGIGIMNIMLVSVTERTREIGLRMAVGAKRGDILMQFLVEAITLCLLGGLIGIAIGIGTAYITAKAAEWPILIAPEVVLIALGAAAATGIFFGFFPARRAAHLNPIEALRSE
jgi:putative ABC transport system permease protein